MLRALFCVLAAFSRAAAVLRQVLIFYKIQNLEDDHMGFADTEVSLTQRMSEYIASKV